MSDVFAQLDPRTRILSVVCAILIVASSPRGELLPFAAYIPLSLLLVATQRVSVSYLATRCLVASPFILLASGLLLLRDGVSEAALRAAAPAALSVAGKACLAVLLLAFLTASTPLPALLTGFRRLGAPESLNLILGMMLRYNSLLTEEYSRMERARDSRTVVPLGQRRYGVYGRQIGVLVLRSWDRAERVHGAMLSRGFNGVWPDAQRSRLGALDWTFLIAVAGTFLTVRVLL